MKYLISENRLEKFMFDHFDKIFKPEDIHWMHPWGYNEDGEEDDSEGEDENRIQFYIGDYEQGENDCFKWYSCNYFTPESYAQDICPTVVIDSPFDRELNGYFNNTWQGPFKKWFIKNFELPVKTVDWM